MSRRPAPRAAGRDVKSGARAGFTLSISLVCVLAFLGYGRHDERPELAVQYSVSGDLAAVIDVKHPLQVPAQVRVDGGIQIGHHSMLVQKPVLSELHTPDTTLRRRTDAPVRIVRDPNNLIVIVD